MRKDKTEQLVTQWNRTGAFHTGAKKLRQSIQARFEVSKLKDICKKVCAHCMVYQAQNRANYKALSDPQFYPIS